ncbi:hypothetical protein EYC84_009872 [Monilinia fructicola]|uniref:DUF7820 domain-containing protein n=1 Tax=Monilinia fructicola TaxID=38448 RepID=A0A5M9JG20_MONFR|nr:hypothetical protein EYC84_009872 [Monilinia fructicola]
MDTRNNYHLTLNIPDEAFARKARPASIPVPVPIPTIQMPAPIVPISGAGGMGLATRNPEFASQEDLRSSGSRQSARRTVFAILRPKHNKDPNKQHHNDGGKSSQTTVYATMTTTFDATPLSTVPVSLPSLPTGGLTTCLSPFPQLLRVVVSLAAGFMGRKGVAQAGDKPWFCYWNGTLLEAFIYVNETSSSGSSTVTSSYPSATPNGGYGGYGTNTWSSDVPSSTSGVQSQDSSSSGSSQPNEPPQFLPQYSKVYKIAERRIPRGGQTVPAYCVAHPNPVEWECRTFNELNWTANYHLPKRD